MERWRKSEDGPDVEKIVTFYVASHLHGQFFYVAIFICHIKLTRQLFSKCSCHIKIGHFSSSTRANKNCHIKIARVDGA